MFGKHILKNTDFWIGITCAGILMSSIHSIKDVIKMCKTDSSKKSSQ
jgi:hypothetical protein